MHAHTQLLLWQVLVLLLQRLCARACGHAYQCNDSSSCPAPAAAACRLSSVKHCLSPDQLQQLAATTHGFVGADLAALVNEAALAALRRHVQQLASTAVAGHGALAARPAALQAQQDGKAAVQLQHQQAGLCVTAEDMAAARLLVRPSALREVAIEVPQVRCQWQALLATHSLNAWCSALHQLA